MNKSYITVVKEDGSTEEMELITSFRLNDSGKNCLIYRSNSDEYYAASYDELNDEIDLNTNFTDRQAGEEQTCMGYFARGFAESSL